MSTTVPAGKCEILIFTDSGEISVEGVEQSHIDALRLIAEEETRSDRVQTTGWCSTWLASVAKEKSAEQIYELALRHLDERDGAVERGIEQAEAIAGTSFVNRPDVIAFAYEAVRIWIEAYLGWSGKPSQIVTASRSKVRIRNGPSPANLIKRERLRDAVSSLLRLHPDWRVVGAEIVRLNPKKSSLASTGVATFVEFDGHDKVAIVWKIEDAWSQHPPRSSRSSAS